MQKYLCVVNNFEQRRTITKFRISAHRLMIEQGRYLGIPSDNRICLKCSSNEVEDEQHFLFSCPKHIQERTKLFELIAESCANFANLGERDKLIWLMSCENISVLSCLAQFISKNENVTREPA